MSLHTLANHLQSAGRGEDKQLVHMTPGEVEGLQAIAMAHGGSLTINPETGLPEAGFLSSILPMIAGFGLTALSGGALSPLMAAGIVGGGTAVATGSLKQGLMAGLGAYGGAGMGAGLAAQGAQGAAAASTGSGVGLNAANAGTGVGVNAANAGAGVGLKAQTVFGPNVASTGTGYAGFQNPVLDAGFKNPVALTTPPAASSAVTNASAYSPASSFNVGQNLSGLGTNAPTVTSKIPTSVADKQAIIADQVGGYDVTGGVSKAYHPPSLLDLKAGARQTYPDLSNVKYGGGWGTAPGGRYFIENPAPAPLPLTSTTSKPFAGGIQNQYAGPSNAVNTTGQSISRPFSDRMSQLGRGFEASTKDFEGLKGLYNAMPQGSVIASGLTLAEAMKPEDKKPEKQKSLIRPYEFTYGATGADRAPYTGSAERTYFAPQYTALTPYEAPGPEYAAEGGLMGYQAGGQIERMAAQNAMGANTGYPMASLQTPMYSNPETQRPEATNVIAPSVDAGVGAYTGEARFRGGGVAEPKSSGYKYDYNPQTMQFTQTSGPTPVNQGPFNLIGRALAQGVNQPQITPNGTVTGGIVQPAMQPAAPAQPLIPNINIPAYQTPEQQLGLGGFYDYMNQQLGGMGRYSGYARGGNVGGGISHLGDYSDGGRLLKGPGDGVSDSIPASIGNRQPARLADGEFVIPARIVSEIGNGSTEAGARKLYAMMDRVQKARRKTVGKNQVARNTKAEKLLPA